MRAGPDTGVVAQVTRLRDSLERETLAIEKLLSPPEPESGNGDARLPGREELCRQLTALRARAFRAASETESPAALRAELATLLFFARTLRADADAWRAGLRQAVRELERQEATIRRERERAAAEQAEFLCRRDALQAEIDRQASRVARQKGGECRRTLPVVTLWPGLTVSSVTVSSSRRRFGSVKLWLVTPDRAGRGVQVIRA